MDVLSVHQACKFAKEWTTSGKGPLVLEFVTYRYGGHSMSDPGTTYRTREEIQRMRSTQDAINGIKTYLSEWGVLDDKELKNIDKKAKAEVEQAVTEAKESKPPGLDKFWEDVYYKGTEPAFLRGRSVEKRSLYTHDDAEKLTSIRFISFFPHQYRTQDEMKYF